MSTSRRNWKQLLAVVAVGFGGLALGFASSTLFSTTKTGRNDPPEPAEGGWVVVADPHPAEMPREERPPVMPDSTAGKWALLVGVTKYDNLAASSHLNGPANDVKLLRATLIGRYGFPAGNVVSLTEDEGQPQLRPIRANIVREFKRLSEIARPGDQVVVLFAGHGDRQPESDPPDPISPEPDGIDEIFLPADVKPWKGYPERVPNAVADKELRDLLGAITNKKAYVWAIFDCCHSSSMSRELPGGDVARQLPPGILVPDAELAKARERAGKRPGRGDQAPDAKVSPVASGPAKEYLVATFACREFETTPECPLPSNSATAKSHGLLTYSLVSGLEKSAASGTPLTYRELMQRVQASYLARPQGAPTPTIVGVGQDRVLLGSEKPVRPKITLLRVKGDYIANVGDLHGITPGSVLSVFSPAGEKEKSRILGHVRVEQVRPLESVVLPVEYAGMPKPAELPATGLCEVVAVDFSVRHLRVGVESNQRGPEDLKTRIGNALLSNSGSPTRSKEEAALFQYVDTAPDFVVRQTAKGMELQVASGNRLPIPLPPLDTEEFGQVLVKNLKMIHRVSGLISVGTHLEGERSRSAEGPEVQINVVGHQTRDDPGKVIERPATGWVFRSGDRISFRVTNTSKTKRLEVTLLVVDPEYRVQLFYPARTEINKALEPGASFNTRIGRIDDNPPFGPEQMVAIITSPTNPPVDYNLLLQPGVQGRGNTANSPLAQLLDRNMHGVGKRSGLTLTELEEQSARVLSWRTEPALKK